MIISASIKEVETNNPEVVVTAVETVGADKISTLLPLMPAPTTTRFLGKMQLLKEKGSKRRTRERENNKITTEKSPFGPVNADQDTARSSPNSQNRKSSAKLLSKMKMNMMGNLNNVSRKDSIVFEASKKLNVFPTATDKIESSSSLRSNVIAQRFSSVTEKDPKKKPGLSAFKAKTGLLGGKKKKNGLIVDSTKEKFKEIKLRLFFRATVEHSNEEIVRNLGTDNLQIILGQGIEDIAKAATFMNKIIQIKDIGSMKGNCLILKNTAVCTTVFLGKIITKKDKYGLYRGFEKSFAESIKENDNPLLVALQKINSRYESFDSSESRPVSPTSYKLPRKKNEPNAAFEKSFESLQSGLLKVKLGNINEWNQHKHVTGDRQLKAISIPF